MVQPQINEYERQRAERIAANNAKLASLGLVEAMQQFAQGGEGSRPPVPKPAPRKRKMYEVEIEVRRSCRIKGDEPVYNEEHLAAQAMGIDRLELIAMPRRRRVGVNPVALNNMREKRIREVDGDDADAVPRGPVDSGLGVRIQSGRVYDSKYGVTCHWCRQKTLEEHVTCTHPECGAGRRLAVSFCKLCLKNRHGEDILQAEASDKWVCPRCRGSCGDGCTSCCNCGPCRKAAGLAPTHQIINEARAAGFDNVHDFLVHRSTGEGPEVIAARKQQAAWGAWLDVPFDAAAAAAAANSDEEEVQAAAEPAAAVRRAVPDGAGAAVLLYRALRWHLLSASFCAAAKELAPPPTQRTRGRQATVTATAAAPALAPQAAVAAASKAAAAAAGRVAAAAATRRSGRGNNAGGRSSRAKLPATVTAFFKPVAVAAAVAAAPAAGQKAAASRRSSGRLGLRARK